VGTMGDVVRTVRGLGDVEILESYLFLVWSEWDTVYLSGITEMCASIREDLCGIGMGRRREVLIKRLDHVLGQLDRGLGHLQQQNPVLGGDHVPEAREQYGELRDILLEVDKEASEILTSTSYRSTHPLDLLTHPQNPTRRLFVPSLSHACSPPSTTLNSRSPNSELRTLFSHGFPSVSLRRFDPR